MTTYACPSCGAPITFKSSFSVYAVCASCGSTVLRGDRDVSLIGQMADLPDEISPMQVGTTFTYERRLFTLLGRVRMAWADGAWNEWFADGGDGRQAWLAEAQGAFAVSFERDLPPPIETGTPRLDDVVAFGAQRFRVVDVKQASCVGSEGELPFKAPRGRTATYCDMIGRDGGFAGLEVGEDGRRFYVGSYVEFDELRFAHMRPVEGWTEPRAA